MARTARVAGVALALVGLAGTASCAAEDNSQETSEENVQSTQQELIGGGAVGATTLPEVVFIKSTRGSCTGTFVSPRHILTAAHCLPPFDATSLQWTRQSLATQGLTTSTIRAIHRDAVTIVPPSVDSTRTTSASNDIGVIELDGSPSTAWHTLVSTPFRAGPQSGTFTVAGYGCTTPGAGYGTRKVGYVPGGTVGAFPWGSADYVYVVRRPVDVVVSPSLSGGFTYWRGLFMSRTYNAQIYSGSRYVGTLGPSQVGGCSGDSGGPLYAGSRLAGILTQVNDLSATSAFERLDDHIPWLTSLGLMNAGTVPIHRSYNQAIGDHMQGLVQNEGAPAWAYEGVSFKLWSANLGNSAPLYRCKYPDSDHHFLSGAANCEGLTVQGALGWLSTVQVPASVPLYRCYKIGSRDHLSTTSPSECVAAGYTVEFQQGWVSTR